MPTPADLRRDIARLTGLAQRDVATIFRRLETAAEAREALNDVLPTLTRQYGEAASLVAAEWYDDLRDEQAVQGRFRAIPADLPSQDTESLTGWASTTATDLASMEALIIGGLSRRISDWSRETIMGSSFADPRGEGWQRVARADGCQFCVMLAGRGFVYTESTVKFASHDSCHCGATPKWAGKATLVDVEEYRASQRRRSDETREADNARARKWIADHL